MDLICGNFYGKLFLFTRQPDGSLKKEPELCYTHDGKQYEIDPGRFGTPQFDDWNEDGYLDLIVAGYFGTGSYNNRLSLYMNTNDHTDSPVFNFADFSKIQNTCNRKRCGLDVVDLDLDGKKDLVMGSELGFVYFCKNVGTNSNPVFKGNVKLKTIDGIDIDPGSRTREEIFDWNADGIPDLILGEMGDYIKNNAPIYVYLGVPTAIEDEKNATILEHHLAIQLLQNPVVNFAIPIELVSSTTAQAVADIFDIYGRLQSTMQLDLNAGTNKVILDASNIPPGICLVRVTSDSATASARVVLGY